MPLKLIENGLIVIEFKSIRQRQYIYITTSLLIQIFHTHGVLGFWGFGVLGLGFRV
jgi:hypothetical protein